MHALGNGSSSSLYQVTILYNFKLCRLLEASTSAESTLQGEILPGIQTSTESEPGYEKLRILIYERTFERIVWNFGGELQGWKKDWMWRGQYVGDMAAAVVTDFLVADFADADTY